MQAGDSLPVMIDEVLKMLKKEEKKKSRRQQNTQVGSSRLAKVSAAAAAAVMVHLSAQPTPTPLLHVTPLYETNK